jgi:hypothetical protein
MGPRSKFSLVVQLGKNRPRFGGVSFMNKVTFRCKRSGNTVSFTNENDIEGLRKHEGYDEVKDVETSETLKVEPQQTPTQEVLKRKPGRPAKALPSFLETQS